MDEERSASLVYLTSGVCTLDAAQRNPGVGVMGERSPATNCDSIGSHAAQCATLIAPYAA